MDWLCMVLEFYLKFAHLAGQGLIRIYIIE